MEGHNSKGHTYFSACASSLFEAQLIPPVVSAGSTPLVDAPPTPLSSPQGQPLGIARKQGCQPFVLGPDPPVGRGFGGRLWVPEPVAVQMELYGALESDPETACPAA